MTPTDHGGARRLVLEIEIPDYFVGDLADLSEEEAAEEAEMAMQLATANVGVVFAYYSGDDPTLLVKAMDGHIVGFKVSSE